MKTIRGSKRSHYMARVGTFLIAVSLIAGMVGCAAAPQHDIDILSANALTETGTTSIIPASIEFAPDVLNLRSTGRFLTAYIELPSGYDVGDIDVSSIKLNDTVPALTKPTTIGDYDSDGIPDLMVKFDRAAVEGLLMPASQVEMTIGGEVAGIAFEGSDTVRVINPAWRSLSVSSTTGGSISVPGEGTFSYKAKTVVDLAATPSSGYRFVNWTGDVGTVGDVNAASTNITMNGHYSITANFVAQYDFTISSTAGGSVPTPGEGTYTYDAETVVNLVATPASGYGFVNWTGNVGTVGDVNAASTNITMNGHYSITANFVAQYDLTISSTAGGSVPTPGEGVFTYDAETVVGLVATPASGFVNWTGDVGTVADINAASTNITMNGHYSITANFEQPVAFPDANLEAAIRKAISKPTGPIYPSNLKGLTTLSALSKNIANLSGLEYCTSLNVLDLPFNQISDISPLANLTNLIRLYLDSNQISDLTPLANLTSLRFLGLFGNEISDLTPLANLTDLVSLELWGNDIGDISPLANLTSLEFLSLHHNWITDISPLANLTSLHNIDLSSNFISDVSPLVQNMGLGTGDTVVLCLNLLSSDSINIYIPQLQDRGVTVYY